MLENDIVRLINDTGTYSGRTRILTGCLPKSMQFPGYVGDTLDEHTIAKELSKAIAIHNKNAAEHRGLRNIYLGRQEILNRPQGDRIVNNKVCVNYAQAFTRDITGYTYGSGVQYVARDAANIEAVDELNKYIRAENKDAIIKSIGDEQSIGGRGFLGVFPDTVEKNEVPFEFVEYDPADTEVVYSSYNPNTPVFAWTRYTATVDAQNINVFNVWTNDRQYTIQSDSLSEISFDNLIWSSFSINGNEKTAFPYRPHLLGEIPIVEYANNQFRLGDWECAVSLFNAINSLASDSINDVEQTVTSYLALFGVDPEEVDWENIRKNKLFIFNGVPGVTQDAKFVTAQLDGTSADMLRAYLEESLKFVVGIPDRDTGTAGSDTGISAQVRTGSGDIEIVASNKCMYTTMAERRTLRIILNILKNTSGTSEKFRNLEVGDIDIEIPRSKTDNFQSKVQAGQMLYAMGVAKEDIVKLMDLSTDITGFVNRWNENEASVKESETEAAETISVYKESDSDDTETVEEFE